MHEPAARTPYEMAVSLFFDNLYRRHAQLEDAVVEPTAAEPTTVGLEARVTYPETKPAQKEEKEVVDAADMRSPSVSPRAKWRQGQEWGGRGRRGGRGNMARSLGHGYRA